MPGCPQLQRAFHLPLQALSCVHFWGSASCLPVLAASAGKQTRQVALPRFLVWMPVGTPGPPCVRPEAAPLPPPPGSTQSYHHDVWSRGDCRSGANLPQRSFCPKVNSPTTKKSSLCSNHSPKEPGIPESRLEGHSAPTGGVRQGKPKPFSMSQKHSVLLLGFQGNRAESALNFHSLVLTLAQPGSLMGCHHPALTLSPSFDLLDLSY